MDMNVNQNQNLYVCVADALNMRVGPSTDFSSIGKLKRGAMFNVKYVVRGWASDGNAWVSMRYLEKYTDDADWVGTTTNPLNVRSGAGIKYSKKFIIPKNTKVTILKERNNWFQIKCKYGTGWVSGKYLK